MIERKKKRKKNLNLIEQTAKSGSHNIQARNIKSIFMRGWPLLTVFQRHGWGLVLDAGPSMFPVGNQERHGPGSHLGRSVSAACWKQTAPQLGPG